MSAWVNTFSAARGGNLIINSEQASLWGADQVTITSDSILAPDGTVSGDLVVTNTGVISGNGSSGAGTVAPTWLTGTTSTPGGLTVAVHFKKQNNRFAGITTHWYTSIGVILDLDTGSVVVNSWHPFFGAVTSNVTTLSNGWYRLAVNFPPGASVGAVFLIVSQSVSDVKFTGNGTDGVYVWGASAENSITAVPSVYLKTVGSAINPIGRIADRSAATGASFALGLDGIGKLIATAYDGTTTRTVTTSTAYNNATFVNARAIYKTDGSLAITVNGVQIAISYANPLLTLNNSNAVLTIGNSYALDAPFPGSIAQLKFSATAPTQEQSTFMYEQEKQMFRDGAQSLLPDSGAVVDLAYDDVTDKWIAASAANESSWVGLVRTGVTAVPAGSNIKVQATSGVKLNARSTTNPGVDVTLPAYNLKEEIVKRGEAAAKLSRITSSFDYVGGFTATTVVGNTAITAVLGLVYPATVNLRGCVVTGAGIPASTTIVDIVGTTIYLSAKATAAGTLVQISLTDFPLPVGYEAKSVITAGAIKVEGSTKDFTRLFDGFKETIRFGTAPGYTAAVQIQAIRSAT